MKVQLTEEQSAAVFAPVSENLVSAAAGSGKTKVLSERIVERLKSGDTSIDRLLIVTFTRAAALQMRDRIGSALEKEYMRTKTKALKKQLSLIASADICTIDSFCINLVKRNFFRTEVPPDFNIADANEMRILREEVILDVLEQMYESEDENFLLLAEGLGSGKTDDALKEMIIKTYFFTMAFEDADEWLDYALEGHTPGSELNDSLYDMLKQEIADRLEELGLMLESIKEEAENYSLETYVPVLSKECDDFNRYFGKDSENVGIGMELFTFGGFSSKKGGAENPDAKKYIQALHKSAKDMFAKIYELYDLCRGERGVSYKKIEALVRCVRLFSKLYMEEKLARKVLEFADCEYYALKILKTSPEVREELRDKYDEIYIDEYQDTNHLQDALFSLISRKDRGEPNLFIVGDIKQSIYRFRHSDPRVFAEKSKKLGKDSKSCKMILSKNFRSRQEVVDSINCVFERIMRESTAQVEYDDEHKLKCGAKFIEYNQNKSELYVLKNKYDLEEDSAEALLAAEQRETFIAAQRIKQLIDEGFLVSDGEKMRPVRYSDIAILSPKITGRAEMFTNMLALMGIPARCQSKQSFFDSVEIRTVMALLQAVDNPLCDIPLASVMRSPIFAFSENELAKIRTDGKDKPFFENVKATAKEKTRLGKKCKSLVKTLADWREEAYVTSLERFITRVVDDCGYYSFVGALPGGGMRQENLRRFVSIAASYEKSQYKGLYNFVTYINRTVETGGEVESETHADDESVLITSIHKSKGLEFPVVFVIGCGSAFNNSDSYSNLVANPVGGMAVAEREAGRRVKFKTGEYEAIALMIKRESHAEQMRLLYVAMTRAKEKLILIGSAKSLEKKLTSWETYSSGKRMSDYKIRGMNNYLEYVANSIDKKYWDMHVVWDLPELVTKYEADESKDVEHKTIEEVIYRLSYMYPYDGIRNIPSKMSVSEIKKLSMDEEESVSYFRPVAERRVPSFMKDNEKLTGNRRGTAFHRVMELVDLEEKDVKGAIAKFVEKGFMTAVEAESVECEKIERFLESDVAERMRQARKIWREESFTVEINAKDVFDNGEDEKICVQGTIDCLFEDKDGKIVLLDYKTDYYTNPEDIGKRYKKQLELYEVAVFKRFGQGCDEKCLYLFHGDEALFI